ncbi:GL26419 [Drosophila persimilis]|uniref:GL26419 n=1 Tax=Drosophila persimilis TaxID=7234 RepID=B4GSU5_DROPE|nr:la protein homolog [Drosophila persimilis]EDW25454.1 GL26419 [Drosophila persimilis]
MADVAETTVPEVKEPVEEVTKAEEVAAEEPEAKNGDSKEEPASAADGDFSKQERAIIRQVEYYFGDANLNRDKFLREQIAKNEDGWVPLSVLITFKRLATLSTDFDEIIAALNKSDEGLVQISEDKQSLRRHPERPIPEHNEERRKEIQERTAYAKGFPLDSLMSELLDFFSSYEKVVNITMRKHYDKPTKSYKFKGSIFLTFETKDQATAFLEKDNKVVYKERELLRKWQIDYLKEKQEEYQLKSEKKQKKKEAKAEPAIELPKNAIVVFEGAPETVSREEIREAFEKVKDFDIAYIEFNKGDTKGSVRLTEADAAEKYISKVEEGKLKFNEEVTLTLRKATEDEEKTFLDKAVEFMKKRRDFSRNKNKRFGRKRHGGNDNRQGKKSRAE